MNELPVYLREICSQDVPAINIWRRDRDITDSLGGAFRMVNLETDEAWFNRYMMARDRDVRMAVVLRSTDQLIGVSYLLGIDWVHRSAEYGLILGVKTEWGKGYGTIAERLTLQHAFHDLNLHRVFLTVFADNERVIRIHEKYGFRVEGVLKEAVFKGGRYRDLVSMAITSDEFAALEAPVANADKPK